jgi:hypothetical protein
VVDQFPGAVVSGGRISRGAQELAVPDGARAAESRGWSRLEFVVGLPAGLGLAGLPADPVLGEVRLVIELGQVWLGFGSVPGPRGATLPCPAPRGIGDRTSPGRPPIGDVLFQVQNPEFYLGEPVVTIFDKIFESLVRRYHP